VARDADALVLVTEWPQYLELNWESLASVMRTPILLDARHVLDRARVTRAGFRYLSLAG
jgi:UDPglucose 6-dehydrogenase